MLIVGDVARSEERNQSMNIDTDANNAITAADRIHGRLESDRESQLSPIGGMMTFKNNIGSGHLIGPGAVSNLVQAIFRFLNVKLSTPITIGDKTVNGFDNNLDPVMGLARLFNM